MLSQDGPLVIVCGSTGIQGGSVIQALSNSMKPYRIRGLTQNANEPATQEIANKGVMMYSVNILIGNDEAVKKASKGGVYDFIVTMCAKPPF